MSRTASGKRLLNATLQLLVLEDRTVPDAGSIGLNGINVTGGTGAGIKIGQVEVQRPGKPGFDDAAFVNTSVNQTEVYYLTLAPTKNVGIISHAGMDGVPRGHGTQVAGIMISNSPGALKGVAPGAQLIAS